MKILVIGSGGREHALAWRLAQAPRVQKVYVAPGNAGTALENGVQNVAISDIAELLAFAQQENIYLTVVGPEAPLAKGVVDTFRRAGLKIFGPTRAAAQLESSKDFAKAFMVRHAIPTAFYETFSDVAAAHAYVNKHGAPIVIKADGLAAGKGVVVAMSLNEAHDAIDMMLSDNKLGDAGARVVIEEFLTGEEASFIVMVDGKNVLPLATSQDHKRLQDGDLGPNTGGTPIGSMTMPSHFSVVATRRLGRTCRSNGPITVGPVTTKNRAQQTTQPPLEAKCKVRCNRRPQESDQIPPIVHSRSAVLPASRSSPNFSDKPPSNMITATESETSGKRSRGPADSSPPVNSAIRLSGLTNCPNTTPNSSSNRIPGKIGPPGNPLRCEAQCGDDRQIEQEVHAGFLRRERKISREGS